MFVFFPGSQVKRVRLVAGLIAASADALVGFVDVLLRHMIIRLELRITAVSDAHKFSHHAVDNFPVRRFDEAKLRGLAPAFKEGGTITAGNASGVNDGAAAMLIVAEEQLRRLNITPMARILGYSQKALAPEWFTIAPVEAIQVLLRKLKMEADDFDVYEINEAFAVVTMAAIKELRLDPDRVNIHGGAVALGHPLGASGARILTTLLHALKRTGGKRGIASLCIGGGGAVALAVELC